MRVPVGLIRFLCLCALGGILFAGVMAPVAIGLGEGSNQLSDSVDSISSDLTDAEFPLVTTVTDRDGNPIAYLFDQYRLPVSFNQISPNMTNAVIAIEDKRFYQHAGIDVKGALRAAVSNSSGGSTQGASTITQQYVKNFLINVVDRNNKTAQAEDQAQTVVRKLREAKMAMTLDEEWSKNNILTGYLNVVQFGHTGIGPYGVGAAAAAFFGTTPDKLTVPQSALLAGMVNNPVFYDPYHHPEQALARRNLVIDKMVENRALSAADAAQDKKAPLGVLQGGPVIPSSTCIGAPADAGFFCNYAVTYLQQAGFTPDQINTGGYTIKTTMDPHISQIARQTVLSRIPPNADGLAHTFDIVRPGTTSHQVVALVSNRTYGDDPRAGQTLTNLPATTSDPFGAGSTFKITTTAAALERGTVGLNTVLPNPPSACYTYLDPRYNSCYPVQNAEKAAAQLPLFQALAISPNTYFVGLELKTGLSNVLNMAYRLGLRDTMLTNSFGQPPDPKAHNVQISEPQIQTFRTHASFTLGVAALSPLELANMIATLGSGGVWCPPTPILSVTDRYGKNVPFQQQPCERVVPTGLANTELNGLSHDTEPGGTSKAPADATGWKLPLVGKTGTTQRSESLAFVGLTGGYAASSIFFADGPHPEQICDSTGQPHISPNCSTGFGGPISAPTFFKAFEKILAGQQVPPIVGPDPAYMTTGNRGATVPFVMLQQSSSAVQELTAAGYHATLVPFNSKQPKGMVVGQTPQGNQVAKGTAITLYVSTGSLPPPQVSTAPPSIAPGSTGG
ncbi:MAG TPA: penicillin-binding protein [Pseudonocardiaceae bacterium]|nr:penicillin-binding protein [Pseudonocardiaceae bacterium]